METHGAGTVVMLPDGGYGWVIMIVSFLANFLTDGIISSCGQFMVSLTKDLKATPAAVSLIGSLLVGVAQLAGPLASGISNRYGFRVSVIVGSLIAAAGFASSYFATSVDSLYGTYGFVGGIGFGLVYVPSALAVNFWFTRWRALATGVALVGYNAGGVVLPVVLDLCIESYGWRITFLVEAALMLGCSLLGPFFLPPPAMTILQPGTAGASLTSMGLSLTSRMRVKSGNIHNKNYASVMEIMGPEESVGSLQWGPAGWQGAPTRPKGERCKVCCHNFLTCHWKCKRRPKTHGVRPFYRDDIFYGGSTVRLEQYQSHREFGEKVYNLKVTRVASHRDVMEELSTRCVMFPHALRRTLVTMCDFTLLRSPAMVLQTTCSLAAATAFYTPYIFLPARGISKGLTSMDATLYVTTISAAAAIGRITCAVMASLPCSNHFYLQSAAQTFGGCAVLACGFPIPYIAQLVCCAVYGMSIAFTSNLRSIIIVDLVGLQNLTNAFGLLLMFQGVGYIVGPPIAGVILGATDDNYDTVFWFAGALILVSAVCSYPLNELAKRGKTHDIVKQRRR